MVLSNKEWLDKMDEIISAIQNNGVDSQVIMDMLSNMWSSSVTYNAGDYVLYNNNIWKCLVQNSNIAPTEGSTWTSVKITNEISTLNSNFVGLEKHYFLKENISFNNQSAYSFGNISILTNGKVTLNNLKCVSICASKVTLTAPVVNPEGILNIFSSDGNITINTTVWIDIIYEE